ncbi:MAG: Glyceraldehyde-3-phosphate dehydrogenase-like protein [Candidatus Moanabacter tarae]|uniref:Glyceraldehyde-3-phosphate dehydrogenase-like protein n=1 Tax=Candidatus Moanibacter tarae TaxID=2200854 RepID=A0A2Z4AFC5_9BACT|nr:MAG: Glyceraldehyde-3-phosphate dehydrogenase-like protein [Candidatus Moanabacter tarae]|tara:strand:+ start:1457 stop:2905 length:1449 start_codon:yes stop_codon:yes gene_type:complete
MAEDKKIQTYFDDWIEREAIAERMVPVIGSLYREKGLVITIFGRSLIRSSPIDIIKAHRFARRILGEELPLKLGSKIVETLAKIDLPASRIDIGKLAKIFQNENGGLDVSTFIRASLDACKETSNVMQNKPKDIVLYGFGRIGRMVARILIDRSGGGDKWRLRAIVVKGRGPEELTKRASLLRRDSIHGPFKGTIQIDEEMNALIINGNLVRIINADSPEQVDYDQYDIEDAIIVDNTGVWRDRTGLEKHLMSNGAGYVILTAPGKGDIPDIIYGVNNQDIQEDDRIISAASCTTNAIVPVLKAMDDRFKIKQGHIDTCHSYTNDQHLIDNFHRKDRRGRAAPLNMVITETGAASAVTKALPALDGKLTANAIRVPTPNVSLAILKLNLVATTTVEEVNEYLRAISLDSPLQSQIDYTTSKEVVSSDFIGYLKTSIIDSETTIVQGKQCVLYVWYDNEFGYAGQVIRIIQHLTRLELPSFPK